VNNFIEAQSEEDEKEYLGKKRGRKPATKKKIHKINKNKSAGFEDFILLDNEAAEDKENSVPDVWYCSPGVKTVKDMTFRCDEKTNNNHKFAITNIPLTKSKTWVVTIIKKVPGWLGLGVCDRSILERNDFKFSNSINNHGCFMLSSNGYSWNCNNINENNKLQKGFPPLKDGDKIKFFYEYLTESLHISFKDFKFKLTNVRGNLSPFAIFLAMGDEVAFIE
jgi:hypothetical protein